MKKLFLSLSLLTMAFSQVNAFGLSEAMKNQLAKPFGYAHLASTSARAEALRNMAAKPFGYAYLAKTSATGQKIAQVALDAKVAAVTVPGAIIGGSFYAGEKMLQAQAKQAAQAEVNYQANLAVYNAANVESNKFNAQRLSEMTKFGRVKSALMNAGSKITSNVMAHPRIATGAGLITLTGLSYLAYNKFGKVAKTVAPKVQAPVAQKAITSTPVVTPKTKKAGNRLPGGYARHK